MSCLKRLSLNAPKNCVAVMPQKERSRKRDRLSVFGRAPFRVVGSVSDDVCATPAVLSSSDSKPMASHPAKKPSQQSAHDTIWSAEKITRCEKHDALRALH